MALEGISGASPTWYTRHDFPAAAPVAVISTSFSSKLLRSGPCFQRQLRICSYFLGRVISLFNNKSSTLKNPTLLYPTEGTYFVSLNITMQTEAIRPHKPIHPCA
jgi:hypothetical protein